MDVHVAAVQDDSDIEEAAREAGRLYLDLVTRLEERGVTPEEMEAAIDAGDEEAIREVSAATCVAQACGDGPGWSRK